MFHRLLFYHLFYYISLSLSAIRICNFLFVYFEMLSHSLICSQCSHAEIREQPQRKSSFRRKPATTITQISQRKECPHISVFLFGDAATFCRIPFDSPRKSEPPVRVGLREVKEEEESATPKGAPNPCGSWRERRFTDY